VRGPLQDKRVRKMIDLAFDRHAFVQDAMGGHAQVPRGLLPEALPDFDPSIPEPKVDLEKAKQLLDEAGWKDTDGDGIRDKDGQPLKLTIMYLQQYQWERMGSELLQANLAKIGVRLEIEGQPWPTMVERMKDPRARPDINFVAVYATSPSADTTWWPMFHSNSGHWSNFEYSDPFVDQKLEEARRTIDNAARQKIYHELGRYLMDEAPAVPAASLTMIFAATSNVKGYVFQPMDPFIVSLYDLYLE
jgi:peptide/nickel transport system substrate-binding protein